MTDVVRYGIIGTGMMGCEHILNLSLIPDRSASDVRLS